MQERSGRSLSIASKNSVSSTNSTVTETDRVTEVVEWNNDKRQLNQYRLCERLGEGTSAVVYRAEVETESGLHQFAIKEVSRLRMKRNNRRLPVISPGRSRRTSGRSTPASTSRYDATSAQSSQVESESLANQRGTLSPPQSPAVSDGLDAIRREIAILKQMEHPNIVRLFEVLDDPQNEMLYMVFELCSKGPLMRIELDTNIPPFKEEDAHRYFVQLFLGIEYLHSKNIAHRDIKPENLLLNADGQLKVADFGVSEFIEPDGMVINSAGSPAFMSPEASIANHGKISAWACDVWSMGVTLYCFLAGHLPFSGNSIMHLHQNIRESTFISLNSCSKSAIDLVARMLQKDPTKRITLPDIRVHPWVTKNGSKPLVSHNENCSAVYDRMEIDGTRSGFFRKLLKRLTGNDTKNNNNLDNPDKKRNSINSKSLPVIPQEDSFAEFPIESDMKANITDRNVHLS